MGNITSTAFTNERVLFATRAAAEAWRTSLNTADATATVAGAMKKATLPVAVGNSIVAEYVTVQVLQGDGSYISEILPTKDAYDSMKTLVEELKTTVNALRAAMIAAGQGQ